MPKHFTRKRAAKGDGGRTESNSQARRDERGAALVHEDSGGSGGCREQQQLSDRRGSRRRPCTAELGGNLLRSGDGPSDAHGPAAAGANGDVDAEDAGDELHPRQPRRGSIAELSVEQGGDGGQLELAARDEERELLGLGLGVVGTRHDGSGDLLWELGIRNGDEPRTVNGYGVSTVDGAYDAWWALRSAKVFTMVVARGRGTTTLKFKLI